MNIAIPKNGIASDWGDNTYGLFGMVNGGTVKNLTVHNIQFSTPSDNRYTAGGVAGTLYKATLENCTTTGPSAAT